MKKILSIIAIFAIFILIYFLQSNFFNWFNIAGIKPNLFIILILIVGIYIGKIYGMWIGVILGLLLDFFIGKALGLNAIILGISGILGGVVAKNVSKDSRMTIMLMTAGATLACETVSYIIQIIIFKLNIEVITFIKILLVEILYNTMIIIIIYPLIYRAGTHLQENFSKDKILTRYY